MKTYYAIFMAIKVKYVAKNILIKLNDFIMLQKGYQIMIAITITIKKREIKSVTLFTENFSYLVENSLQEDFESCPSP